MLFSPNSRAFGLEIGGHTLRAAWVNQGPFGLKLEAFHELELTRSPWLKNGLRDRKELVKQLKTILIKAQPHPITLTRVNLSLPESSIFSKVIRLPKVSTRELHQTIPFEAADLLPLPLEEMYLDWQIDPATSWANDEEMINILIVAAPKGLVDELLSVTKEAGLTVKGLESESFSLTRALSHKLLARKVTVIVNLGHRTSTLIFTTSKAIKFTATAPIGAQGLKDRPGEALATIAEEIIEGVTYYHNRLGETEAIDRVLLTGPGATLIGLAAKFNKAVKTPTEIGYPIINLPDNQPIHPRFATVFGLALRP